MEDINETFISKIVSNISNEFNFNIDDQRKLINVLYKSLYNYKILEIETNKNSFMELVSIYNYTRKIEGLSDITLKNRY